MKEGVMRMRSPWVVGALAIAVAAGASSLAAGQGPGGGSKTPPSGAGSGRTPWGDPDVQGLWSTATVTPLQRPVEFANKEFLTDAEVASFEAKIAAERVDRAPREGDPGTYNQHWFDRGTHMGGTHRTSLIVDPPDGRIPPYTPDADKRVKAEAAARRARLAGKAPFLTWTDLDPGERCITDGLPMLPYAYNNNYLIMQSPGYVAIFHEMFHDYRVVPLDGRPHVGPAIRQWLGDAKGHWEGNTLVVDSTNFSASVAETNNPRGAGQNLHLIERFTRIDAKTLEYKFTVDDPTTFTKAWTALVPMTNDQASAGATVGQLFEYACHEGNYAMVDVLGGGAEMVKSKKGSR
jgi:hypothetical protein